MDRLKLLLKYLAERLHMLGQAVLLLSYPDCSLDVFHLPKECKPNLNTLPPSMYPIFIISSQHRLRLGSIDQGAWNLTQTTEKDESRAAFVSVLAREWSCKAASSFHRSFLIPIPSWGNVPEVDSEAVPMASLRRLRSCFFDDGLHSDIREGDLANIRRKCLIHPSVGMRSPTEFERAPDGGAGEVAVYEAYLEAVFGELHGFSIGVQEILYSYYFAPLANKDGFYHLRSRDGAPLVEEPSRGVRGNRLFGDGWNSRYVFVKIREPVGYPTSWRTVDVSRPVSFAGEAVANLVMGIPRRFRWVTFLVSREALRHSRVWGNAVRAPVSVIYDEYQKVKARKRRLSYTPPPRLARAALSAGSLSSNSSTSAEIMPNRDCDTPDRR
ncbi:hypothetical protein F2Q70_00038602 [Brassica cretica]|uniref:Uncharacterized protein n=1 Tax=Brassica cretica TaxID=69181 RepID=A0A8S9K5L0_BRACR|nr:hypothetical protein F2Q70_00038602 [Brassica cretica]